MSLKMELKSDQAFSGEKKYQKNNHNHRNV